MQHRKKKEPLTPHEVRVVAVKALVDPRTVQSMIDGGDIRSTCRARIEAALVELGWTL